MITPDVLSEHDASLDQAEQRTSSLERAASEDARRIELLNRQAEMIRHEWRGR